MFGDEEIARSLKTKRVFDGRNVYEPAVVKAPGLVYEGLVGKPPHREPHEGRRGDPQHDTPVISSAPYKALLIK
jgi:hypothetical protein